ncbi:MAG: hypothetical protein AAGO57_08395, partial [Pseudomonadota bacterium]
MKDIMEPGRERDDIDRIVEALLDNPERAQDIKNLLRQKMNAPDVLRVMSATAAERPDDPEPDSDDFWDN